MFADRSRVLPLPRSEYSSATQLPALAPNMCTDAGDPEWKAVEDVYPYGLMRSTFVSAPVCSLRAVCLAGSSERTSFQPDCVATAPTWAYRPLNAPTSIHNPTGLFAAPPTYTTHANLTSGACSPACRL